MPQYAEMIYNGFWFSPERIALQVNPPPSPPPPFPTESPANCNQCRLSVQQP